MPSRSLLRVSLFVFGFLAPAAGCVEGSAPDHTDIGADVEALHSVCATTPAADAALGFDVSKWQGTIDWTKVGAAGKDFVFVRSTSGASYVDPQFAANWKGAKAAGLVRGAYHYFDVSVDGALQADSMLATLGTLDADDLPPVVDVEDAMSETPDTIVARVAAFRDRVRTKLGREPMLYSGGHFWDTYVGSTAFASTPLWTAHWFTDGTTAHCPNTPDAWARWTIWQYSNTGVVSGVSGDVDLDVFDGTRAELLAFAHASAVVVAPTDGGVGTGTDGGVDADASVDAGLAIDASLGIDASPNTDVLAHRRHSRGCAVLAAGSTPRDAGAATSFPALVVLLVHRSWRRRTRTRRESVAS